ncbi:hypothetical protein L1987_33610 [Smallanthus sonchifolius]|uniref:Uncharacterized protein n=1 Tax=Smallanthus sonchifolius TaxID=185202 RepID=A0ACB9HR06_9ASTR|nr:hypothetical protein L1987_33610 [Smallanthus sonchifolius]
MSLTHLSSNLPEPLWWTQQHPYPIMDSSPKNPPFSPADHHRQPPTPTFQEYSYSTDKEPMFEKPLTPSDVGKLNRLVIPKQHAEKYFPLPGADSVDQQKGLLLSFEDETGKPWRFRYSYWNSSQSYVLTKGWSRYVKEKRLDAGDVVLFERHRVDGDRLYIGWRRRPAAVPMQEGVAVGSPAGGGAQINGWTTRVVYNAQYNYPSHHLPLSLPHPYQPASIHAGGVNDNVENNQRDTVASGNPRRVRLFGVNLECPDEPEPEPSTQDGSSQGGQPHYQYYSNSNNINHNMNINFSQMRYHQHQG